jgi:adenylosuccinate lyase
MDGLVVDTARMRANLDLSHRLVFSEAMLLALIDKGMLREDAYRVVQESAMTAWQQGRDFGELIAANPGVQAVMTADEIAAVLDPGRHAAGRDVIFGRLAELSFD